MNEDNKDAPVTDELDDWGSAMAEQVQVTATAASPPPPSGSAGACVPAFAGRDPLRHCPGRY